MSDPFENMAAGMNAPASLIAAVVPSDGADLATSCRALWVGGGGDVVVDTVGGSTNIKFANVPGGFVLPIRAKRVRLTGTTATLILALI